MPQSLSSLERGNPPPRRKACSACIKAKRRCDLGQPGCTRCSLRKIPCRYSRPERSDDSRTGPIDNMSDILKTTDILEVSPQPEVPSTIDAIPTITDTSTSGAFALTLTDFSNDDVFNLGFMSPEPPNSLDTIPPLKTPSASDPSNDTVATGITLPLVPPRTRDLEARSIAVQTRLRYAIDQLNAAPRRMALENGTPWSHPLLYRHSMPRSLEDAQACCALYMAKNEINATVILRSILSRATELASQPMPSGPPELLARTNALLLYSIMMLFDGDIYARTLAEHNLLALRDSAVEILKHINFPNPDTPPQVLSLYPLSMAREFWAEWIFQESARRTSLMTFFFLQTYRLLQGEVAGQCGGNLYLCHSLTISAHLWEAKDAVDFAEAWQGRKYILATPSNLWSVVDDAMAEDVDALGKILLTAMMGIDEFKGWMISRDGRL
ncbi:uncharacterized protein BCR38DRAFT_381888 [Pseudomassariella vexata]|uniref:Zn(2)-C6 fungal-type domain-containing protein n=1 Tax=Pseudomassariella vexata TaxID=1141098 RepID=A0A1Y2EJ78_9PEZI|nr:uncharacterized protein BCR38DRAFT_381888 [Pseudomassariella vexata]ORY71364.1 hypothetical protein BCR38DRAFT_381888 [Pseudomassariella vexata]